MNHYLNYLIEANAGLCIVLLLYYLLLARETDFRLQRRMMLTGILFSLLFPLFHFNRGTNMIPTMDEYIPTYWLPEIVVGTAGESAPIVETNDYWHYAAVAYATGVVVFMMFFLVQLFRIIVLIRKHPGERYGKIVVALTGDTTPTFCFFNFIFIGRSDFSSEEEKQHILRHELVHSEQLHSFDILLLNVISIFFWFNPILRLYKKIFIQLHEFEADARAATNQDVNDYCSLLARVALQSADFKIASHFNQSLTVKRINMMRTLKTKISKWKLVAAATIAPIFFIAIACQDQIADDINEIAANSNAALVVPAHIQQKYDELKKEKPEATFVLIQPTEKAMEKLKDLEAKYGLPKSVHVYKDEASSSTVLEGRSESGVVVTGSDKPKGYIILEYNSEVEQALEDANAGKSNDLSSVFTVVEKMPEFNGGLVALNQYVTENLVYPKAAFDAGVQGTVYTQFVVNADGTVSDVSVLNASYSNSSSAGTQELEIPASIVQQCEQEAIRIIQAMPAWTPGMQRGKNVRVKYVLPIKFRFS